MEAFELLSKKTNLIDMAAENSNYQFRKAATTHSLTPADNMVIDAGNKANYTLEKHQEGLELFIFRRNGKSCAVELLHCKNLIFDLTVTITFTPTTK